MTEAILQSESIHQQEMPEADIDFMVRTYLFSYMLTYEQSLGVPCLGTYASYVWLSVMTCGELIHPFKGGTFLLSNLVIYYYFKIPADFYLLCLLAYISLGGIEITDYSPSRSLEKER